MKPIVKKSALYVFPITMLIAVLSLWSCDESKSINKAGPVLTLTSTSGESKPGSIVTTTVTVDAPEGGKLLTILVNDQPHQSLPDIELGGDLLKNIPISFTLPSTATIGTKFILSFEARDVKDQRSQKALYTATVSTSANKPIIDVFAENSIVADTKWTADKIYRLNGFVRVGKDIKVDGATTPTIQATAKLTIEPGTVIYGKTGAALIIHRGSQLIANGTASTPIVFTSEKPPGSRKSGDWAGVVICGKATNNIKGSTGTDGIAELEGGYGAFHGGGIGTSDDDDNSGSLNYVRIEYAGYAINPNQELNGLTFASVGAGTSVKFVQVSYANDDSFEWFGGKVNCKNIISFKALDDDFDTDNGYSGYVQFGLGIRDPLFADQSGSNGFEADNDGSGSANLPHTSAVFTNMTIIGPKSTVETTMNTLFYSGVHMRRNTKQKLFNSFIVGFPTGIFIDGTQGAPTGVSDAVINAQNNTLVLKNNIVAGVVNWGGNGFGSTSTIDENSISGLPFTPNTNASTNPIGRIVSAGNIPSGSSPFKNGVFTVTERSLNNQPALPWFLQNNKVVARWSDALLGVSTSIFDPSKGTPIVTPTGSLLTSEADFSDPNLSANSFIDKSVSFKGAFGTTDWTTGWVNWNPQSTDYTK